MSNKDEHIIDSEGTKVGTSFCNLRTDSHVSKTSWLAFVAVCIAILGFVLVALDILFAIIRGPGPPSTSGAFVSQRIAALLLLAIGAATGCAAISHIRLFKTTVKGKALAIFAIVLGLGIGIPLFSSYIFSDSMSRVRYEHWQALGSEAPLRSLRDALIQYAADCNGYLPPAEEWCDHLLNHVEGLSTASFVYPGESTGPCDFAFNKHLGRLNLSEIPDDVVLLFEAEGPWNLTGSENLLQHSSRRWKLGILFMDGSFGEYSFMQEKAMGRHNGKLFYRPLRWKP